MSIKIESVTKKFGAFTALDDVSLDIASGELVALLSPSGMGKTTLLRIIAGLEWADAGQVLFHGEDATDTHARERNVGFVFQHYALFRHMTIFENVAFGLRVRPKKERFSESEIKEKVLNLLRLVQLDWLADRYPHQLSGGQRQRIALARSLAVEPKVLLLDEPFGALDAKVRKELRRWLRRLHDEVRATTVFVTHDQEEAMEVADRVVVMNKGRIEQVGTPDEVYQHPATPFVYEFLGDVNVFHGRGYARPHEVDLFREAVQSSVEATVEHVAPRGPAVRVELRSSEGGATIEADLSREQVQDLGLVAGDKVFVRPRNLREFAGVKQAA
jgi:sulfate/thiosulfate transport system ATP-binding protein